ncbi:Hypp7117 [Branchiostoma lanceolatum]|uniref:Hypp7117 protein n=1 Tax=Branchiostoma lanceolatum TaxID=7740 RepID=A0A8J9YXG7_BRALA|nr:Hypp7117 [Branchiostoma lanceolatum]
MVCRRTATTELMTRGGVPVAADRSERPPLVLTRPTGVGVWTVAVGLCVALNLGSDFVYVGKRNSPGSFIGEHFARATVD